MSVYKDWQADLLSSASLPDTKPNRDFLSDWHAHADSDCDLNPIDLTSHNSGSKNCKPVSLPYRPNAHYQSYSSRSWSRTAFYGQITSATYPHLRAALASGDPYKVTDWAKVAVDIGAWGGKTFANVYEDTMSAGGPPPTLKAPQALRGWHDMQRSVNRHLPAALHASKRAHRAALRELRRASKVRL